MECRVVRRLLDAYLNQTLGDDQLKAIEAHLAVCDGCFGALAASQEPLAELDDPELRRMALSEPPPLPEDFTARVLERIEAESPRLLDQIWLWITRHLRRPQLVSAAYALSTTMVVVSAGNLLFLWNETTDQFSVWAAQAQAYWEAFQALTAPGSDWLPRIWQALTALLHLG